MEKFTPYIKPVEISSTNEADPPAMYLSNFTLHSFVFDGVMCASMEGFLQSLKYSDSSRQREICAKHGKDAKKAGAGSNWKEHQVLYWQGTKYPRGSRAYQVLIRQAFDALFENPHFRWSLYLTLGRDLQHSMGKHDIRETVLTVDEFLTQLYRLREKVAAEFEETSQI